MSREGNNITAVEHREVKCAETAFHRPQWGADSRFYHPRVPSPRPTGLRAPPIQYKQRHESEEGAEEDEKEWE